MKRIAVGLAAFGILAVIAVFIRLTADACIAPYQSTESMVKQAMLIISVEVIGYDEPLEIDYQEDRYRGFHKNGEIYFSKESFARAKVTEILRGDCPFNEVALVGGPYDSCCPDPEYIQFKEGEKLFIIINDAPPKNTKRIRIKNCGCVFGGSRDEMIALIDGARESWKKELSYHQEADPAAFQTAESIYKRIRTNGALPQYLYTSFSYATYVSLEVFSETRTSRWSFLTRR